MSPKRAYPIRIPFVALWLTAAASLHAATSDPWLKLTSANFELYTTAGERQGKELIRYFEQVRSFFSQAFGAKPVAPRPARIIVFRNEKEYQPYKPNEVADAYYQAGEGHDFIVMSSASSQHYPVAVHEFTHMMIRQAGLDLPAWLNEGLAELYSTMQSRGDKIMVGQVIPGRMYALTTGRWIPIVELLKVDHKSPVYNEKSRAGIFYAESWGLVHMLNLAPAFKPEIKVFLNALDGQDPAAALRKAYGLTPEQVEAALRGYFSGNTITVSLFDVQLPKNVDAPDIQTSASLPARLALAELQANSREWQAESKTSYEQLAKEFPTNWEVEEGIALLAWHERKLDEAARHFAQAVELGCKNLPSLLQYARVLNYDGQTKQAVTVLMKAAAEYPESSEVQMELGAAMVRNGNYGTAAAALQSVKKVATKEEAFHLYYNLAYAQYRLKDFAHASENAGKARTFTKKPDELASVDRLVSALERPAAEARALEVAREVAPPPKVDDDDGPPRIRRGSNEEPGEEVAQPPAPPSVEGTLEVMDCGVLAKLHVRISGAVKIFVIPDPTKVSIYGSDGKPVEMQCGPQKPARSLKLGYRPIAGMPDIAGAVISLEFK